MDSVIFQCYFRKVDMLLAKMPNQGKVSIKQENMLKQLIYEYEITHECK